MKNLKNLKNLKTAISILCLFALAVSAFSFGAVYAEAETHEYVVGDTDGDGIVNSTDYLQIKSNFLGIYTLKGTAYAMADVDFDGEITTTDYIRIKSSFLDSYTIEDKYEETESGKEKISTCDRLGIELTSGVKEGLGVAGDAETESSTDVMVSDGINYYESPTIEREYSYTNEKGENVSLSSGTYISTLQGTDVI
jgi:hypothetical protein